MLGIENGGKVIVRVMSPTAYRKRYRYGGEDIGSLHNVVFSCAQTIKCVILREG